MQRRPQQVIGTLCAAAVLLSPLSVHANGESARLRALASDELYNLDRDRALATFREAVAADAQDAAAYRGAASALWLSITFRRGNMTVDDYLGKAAQTDTHLPPAPPEIAAAFREAIDHALALSRAHIAANDRDADAHYQLGAAVGLRASYSATVDGSILGAFRSAREAYDEHERVLELDPRRKDAGLIVGTYRYIVSALALPLRWMAYVVGFGGGREKGLQLVEAAADYPGENQADARFALLLLYNREKRYDDALKQLAVLRERYPRNRLVWLESGSTCLRAGRAADADRFLEEGWGRFTSDKRPRMFGEDAIWQYKIGAARAALGHAAAARDALEKALAIDGRGWVHGRSHIELGKLARAGGNRREASQHFQAAIPLCERDNDEAFADEAKRLLKQP
jgi:tetratricopeptide (TPR) repeat protein